MRTKRLSPAKSVLPAQATASANRLTAAETTNRKPTAFLNHRTDSRADTALSSPQDTKRGHATVPVKFFTTSATHQTASPAAETVFVCTDARNPLIAEKVIDVQTKSMHVFPTVKLQDMNACTENATKLRASALNINGENKWKISLLKL